MTRPSFVAGESVFGYLQRTSIPTQETNLTYAGKGKVSMLFPSAIESKFPWLSKILSFEQIVKEHTPFRLFAAYLSRKERRYLARHYLRKSISGIAHITGIPCCGPKIAGRLKLCLSCLRDDIDSFGIGVMRVVHLLPGIIHCPIHSQRLYEYCGECYEGFGTSHAVRPLTPVCRCGGPLKRVGPELDEISEAAMLAIAEDAFAVLKGALEGLTAEKMAAARAQRAKEMGLVSTSGLINSAALKASIEKSGLAQVVAYLGFTLHRSCVLVKCVSGKRIVRSYLVNLLSDLLLFQGVDGLKKYLLTATSQKPVMTAWEVKALERGKEKVMRALQENPEITRNELWKRHVNSRDMKILVERASNWLNKAVPKKRGNSSNSSSAVENRQRFDHENDLKLIERIFKRYRKLRSNHTRPPINAVRLLNGFPCASCFSKLRKRYPLSALLIERLSESADRDTLNRRKIKVWLPDVKHPHMLTRSMREKLIWIYRNCHHEANA